MQTFYISPIMNEIEMHKNQKRPFFKCVPKIIIIKAIINHNDLKKDEEKQEIKKQKNPNDILLCRAGQVSVERERKEKRGGIPKVHCVVYRCA